MLAEPLFAAFPMKVSVVIPTHKRADLLLRAIESARSAGNDVEIVVVDDASTDDTRRVCERLTGIVYIRSEQRLGVGGARKRGVAASSGEFLSFLDDDDVRLPGSLDLQIGQLEANPSAGLCYGFVHRGTADLSCTGRLLPPEPLSGDIFWQLLARNFIPAISAVFRRSVFDRVGGLSVALAPSDDWDLWVRIAQQYTVTFVDVAVAIWRESTFLSDQGSSRMVEGLFQSSERAFTAFGGLPRARHDVARLRAARAKFADAMIDRLLRETVEAIAGGDRYAIRSLFGALRFSPIRVGKRLLHPRYWRYAVDVLQKRPLHLPSAEISVSAGG